jgi:hypothetical protein
MNTIDDAWLPEQQDTKVAYETIATSNSLLIEVVKNEFGETGGRYEFTINKKGKPKCSIIYEP